MWDIVHMLISMNELCIIQQVNIHLKKIHDLNTKKVENISYTLNVALNSLKETQSKLVVPQWIITLKYKLKQKKQCYNLFVIVLSALWWL